MSTPEEPPESGGEPLPKPVDELLASPEVARAIESEEFKRFLDHVPIAIAVSRVSDEEQRIVYVNAAFEAIVGQPASELAHKSWSVLDGYGHEDDAGLTLGRAVQSGEDLLGVFTRDEPGSAVRLVQAYASVIENEDGTENYRIAALVDISDRERSQREELERRIRDKDVLLRELQHRVKNNLQLITALIRFEARSAQRGDTIDLDRLAGRVESLALLYQTMSTETFAGEIDLGPYLSQIASMAVRSLGHERIRLDLQVSYCPASVNVAMPVGLLANELLTNAFKHAFAGRESGLIVLECRREETRYRIGLTDDGIGLPPGTSWPRPGKLGALILQTLGENTKSMSFQVGSTPGQGTHFAIAFVHTPPSARTN